MDARDTRARASALLALGWLWCAGPAAAQPEAGPAAIETPAPAPALAPMGTAAGRPLEAARLSEYLEQRWGYRFLDSLILEQLILEAAATAGLAPTPGEIDAEFQRFLQEHFLLDDGLYSRWLGEFGRSEQTLLDEIRVQVAQFKLRSRGIDTTEEALRAFFDANPERFARPAWVITRQIIVPRAAGISEDAYRAKAEAVLRRIAAGERFEEVARAESEDINVHRTGGRVGPTPLPLLEGTANSIYEAIKDLEPGTLVPQPVRYGERFVVIELAHRGAEVKPDFERMKRQVLVTYLTDRMLPQDELVAALLADAQVSVTDPRYAGFRPRGEWVSRCGLTLPGWLRE